MKNATDTTAKSLSPTDFKRIEMLIDLYLPEFRADFDRLLAAREATNETVILHSKRSQEGRTDGRALLPRFELAEANIRKEVTALKEHIGRAARAMS